MPTRPIEKEIALGNPGHKAGLGPVSAGRLDVIRPISVADLPDSLGEPGRSAALQVIETAYWWLAPSDVPTLTLLADTINLESAIATQLDAEGLTKPNGNGVEGPNQLIKLLLDVRNQKLALIKSLGLDPLTRAKLGTVRVEGHLKQSKLEKFRSGSSD